MNLKLDLELEKLEAEKQCFAEQGYIGPFKLWEPDVMTDWWKSLRRELLVPGRESRAVFGDHSLQLLTQVFG